MYEHRNLDLMPVSGMSRRLKSYCRCRNRPFQWPGVCKRRSSGHRSILSRRGRRNPYNRAAKQSERRHPVIGAIGRLHEVHAGRLPLFRGGGVRRVAQGCCEIVRVVAPAADDGWRSRRGGRRAGPRPRQSQARAGRGDSRRNRSHRRRAYARPRKRRGARAVATRRHRLPPFAACRAIAASPRWNGRSSKAITIARRLRLSPGRWMGRRRDREQDWCFVARGESARELWERALAPMGLALLTRVVRHAGDTARCPRTRRTSASPPGADDPPNRFAHRGRPPMIASLVVTVIGPDRPGIVSKLSAQAQRFGANWAGSRMASLAGQFAGMVHFEVPPENARSAGRGAARLESAELQIVIARSEGAQVPGGTPRGQARAGRARPARHRPRSVGEPRQRGVSIEELHTEIVSGAMTAEHLFKVKAVLLVPKQREQRRTSAARPRSARQRNDGRHRARRAAVWRSRVGVPPSYPLAGDLLQQIQRR